MPICVLLEVVPFGTLFVFLFCVECRNETGRREIHCALQDVRAAAAARVTTYAPMHISCEHACSKWTAVQRGVQNGWYHGIRRIALFVRRALWSVVYDESPR